MPDIFDTLTDDTPPKGDVFDELDATPESNNVPLFQGGPFGFGHAPVLAPESVSRPVSTAAENTWGVLNTPIAEVHPGGGMVLGKEWTDEDTLREIERIAESGTDAERIGLGLRAGGEKFLSGMATPLSLGTITAAGVMSGVPTLSRMLSAAFALSTGKGLAVDTAKALGEEYAKPPGERDVVKITELWTDAGLGALLAGALGAHAIQGNKAPLTTPRTETTDQNASEITIPTGVPQREVRPQVGEETPLRQPGQAAGEGEPVVVAVAGSPQAQVVPARQLPAEVTLAGLNQAEPPEGMTPLDVYREQLLKGGVPNGPKEETLQVESQPISPVRAVGPPTSPPAQTAPAPAPAITQKPVILEGHKTYSPYPSATLSPDLTQPGKWRLTYFNETFASESKYPVGHETFGSFAEAKAKADELSFSEAKPTSDQGANLHLDLVKPSTAKTSKGGVATLKPSSAALRDVKTGEIFYGEPTHGLLHDKIPDIQSRTLEAGFADKNGNFISQSQAEAATGLSSGEELFSMSPADRKQWFEVQRQQVEYNSSLSPTEKKTRLEQIDANEAKSQNWKIPATQRKQSSPLKPSQEFDGLVIEHGIEHGWTPVDSLLGMPREKSNSGLGTIGIKGKLEWRKALKAARRNAAIQIGLNPEDMTTAEGRAAALPKLKEWIAAEKALIEVPLEEMPAGTTFAIHGEKYTVGETNPDTGMVQVKDGRTFKVDERGIVKLDPGSLAKPAEADVSFGDEEPVKPTPKLRPGEKGTGDLVDSTQREDFALAGEKAVDVERVAREKAEAEKRKREAAELEKKQQQDLFAPKPPAEKPAAPHPAVKQPWEMTKNEYVDAVRSGHSVEGTATGGLTLKQHVQMVALAAKTNHRTFVEQALREGKPVPAEVLADYPDLVKQAEGKSAASPQPAAAGEQPLIGMGGALKGELSESPITATSIKNATVDQERAIRGLPPAIQPARRSFGQVWDSAMAEIDRDPTVQDRLLDELRDRPRALTDREDALLLQRQIDFQNEYGKSTRDLAQAFADGRTLDVEDLKLRTAEWSDKLLDVYQIGKKVGTETGRGLSARRMMAYEDFSLAKMELEKRAANGGRQLTDTERSEIIKLQSRIEELQKRYDDYVDRHSEKGAQDAIDAAYKKLKSETPQYHPKVLEYAEKFVQRMESKSAQYLKELTGATWSPTPEMLGKMAFIGATKLARGGLELAKWTDEMVGVLGERFRPYASQVYDLSKQQLEKETEMLRKDYGENVGKQVKERVQGKMPAGKADIVSKAAKKSAEGKKQDVGLLAQKLARMLVEENPNITRDELVDGVHELLKEAIPGLERRETMDAISGYGDYRQLSKDEVSLRLRDLKGQLQQIGKLEDMAAGEAPRKTGLERRSPSDEERRLIKQVEEAKRRGGYRVTDPAAQLRTALQAAKTAIQHQIEDLQFEISNRERIVKNKHPLTPDNELLDLRAKRDALKDQHKEIFGGRVLSEAQKIKMAEAALDRQISDVESQLQSGEIFPSGKHETPKLSSPGIQAKTKQLAELKLERYYRRQSAQPGLGIEGREYLKLTQGLRAVKARLESQIEQLESAIATRTKIVKDPARTQYDEQANNLRARRDELKEQYDEIFPKEPITEAQRLERWKKRTSEKIQEYQERLANKDFDKRPRRSPPQLDDVAMSLQAQLYEAKRNFQIGLIEDRLAQRPRWEKALDTFLRWYRGGILSSPVVFGKLTVAAAVRSVLTPIEEVVGAGIGKAFPELAKRAPREGYWNSSAEANALVRGFTRGLPDAWNILRKGESELDLLFGKGKEGGVGESHVRPFSIADVPGRTHGAWKATTKRAEFERAYTKILAYYGRQGLDVSHPAIQLQAGIEAYKHAQRSIFLNDNRVVSAYNSALSRLVQPDSGTLKTPFGGRVLATSIRIMTPIVRVPSNIVAEIFQNVTGTITGSARLGRAYAKGIETLKPEEADLIMRELKKGSIGGAAMLLGFLLPNVWGGLYERGEKRKKTDIKPGQARIPGVQVPTFIGGPDIPKWAMHYPLAEVAQTGATISRIAYDPKGGVPKAAAAAVLGIAEMNPLVNEVLAANRAFDPKQQGVYFGDIVGGIAVPQLVQWTAKQLDTDLKGKTVDRKAKTFVQQLKTKVPGLREQVPSKQSSVQIPASVFEANP